MKTSLLVKSLPKYLAVAFSALILVSAALITSALIHADAKASTSPSEPISETNLHEDNPEEAEDITDKTDVDSDNSSVTPEQPDAAQDQVASPNSTSQTNTSTSATSSTNPQSNADFSAPQSNSGTQDQANNNGEQQVAQAGETTASSPEATADATGDSVKDKDSDPISNPQLGYIPGAGKNHPDDKEGDDQDKNLLDLSDYYR